MRHITISIEKMQKILNDELKPEELKIYIVLPNSKFKEINLNERIIIESMMEDIDSAEPNSAFSHRHNLTTKFS